MDQLLSAREVISEEEKLDKYQALFDSLADGNEVLSPDQVVMAATSLGAITSAATALDELGLRANERVNFGRFVDVLERVSRKLGEAWALEVDSDLDESQSQSGSQSGSASDSEMGRVDDAMLRAFSKMFEAMSGGGEFLTPDAVNAHLRTIALREASSDSSELNFCFALLEETGNSPNFRIDVEGFARVAANHTDFFEKQARQRLLERDDSEGSENSDGSDDDAMPQVVGGLDNLKIVFEEFDEENKGFVTDANVNSIMGRLGRRPTTAESDFLFELLELCAERGFTFEAYVDLVRRKPQLQDLAGSVDNWTAHASHAVAGVGPLAGLGALDLMKEGARVSLQRGDERIAMPDGESELSEFRAPALVQMEPDPDYMLSPMHTPKRDAAAAAQSVSAAELLRRMADSDSEEDDEEEEEEEEEPPPQLRNVVPADDGDVDDDSEAHDDSGEDHEDEEGGDEAEEKEEEPGNRGELPTERQDDHRRSQARLELLPSEMLSDLQLARHRAVFNALHPNNSGELTEHGLHQEFHNVTGVEMSMDMARRFVLAHDKTGSGTLGFEEFVAAMQGQLQGAQSQPSPALAQAMDKRRQGVLRELFDEIDANGDGVLTPAEVREFLHLLGHSVENETCARLFRQYANQHLHTLTFDEFCELMRDVAEVEAPKRLADSIV